MDTKEQNSITVDPKKIKYLCINPTKHVEDLYVEDYKILMKEIKKT